MASTTVRSQSALPRSACAYWPQCVSASRVLSTSCVRRFHRMLSTYLRCLSAPHPFGGFPCSSVPQCSSHTTEPSCQSDLEVRPVAALQAFVLRSGRLGRLLPLLLGCGRFDVGRLVLERDPPFVQYTAERGFAMRADVDGPAHQAHPDHLVVLPVAWRDPHVRLQPHRQCLAQAAVCFQHVVEQAFEGSVVLAARLRDRVDPGSARPGRLSQHVPRQAVDRPDKHPFRGLSCQLRDPFADLLGRLVRERHDRDVLRRRSSAPNPDIA